MRPATGNVLETRFDHRLRTLWITLPASPSFLTPDRFVAAQSLPLESGMWLPGEDRVDFDCGWIARHVLPEDGKCARHGAASHRFAATYLSRHFAAITVSPLLFDPIVPGTSRTAFGSEACTTGRR